MFHRILLKAVHGTGQGKKCGFDSRRVADFLIHKVSGMQEVVIKYMV